MKKFLYCFLIFVGLIFSAGAASAVAPGKSLGFVHASDLKCAPDHSCEVKQNDSYISVYDKPHGKEIYRIKAGEIVTPGDVHQGWLHVSFTWECGSIKINDAGALLCSYDGNNDLNAPIPEDIECDLFVNSDDGFANLRISPNGPIIGPVPNGTPLIIFDTFYDYPSELKWSHVQTPYGAKGVMAFHLMGCDGSKGK